MKDILLIFLLMLSIPGFARTSDLKDFPFKPDSDTTVLPQILSLPLQSYIGKPVDSLLNNLPGGFDKRSFMPARLGYIRGVFQVYGTEEFNHCTVEIFIDTFRFLAVPNYIPSQNWDINLARKETIAFIKIIKNNTICVYGCNNPGYY
jgi:hypothetical protein